jgi:hypothetical protein
MMGLHQRLVTRFFTPTNRADAELFEVQSNFPGNAKRKSVEPIAKLPMRTAPTGGQSAMRDFFAHYAWTGADSITFSWLSLLLWQTTPSGYWR